MYFETRGAPASHLLNIIIIPPRAITRKVKRASPHIIKRAALRHICPLQPPCFSELIDLFNSFQQYREFFPARKPYARRGRIEALEIVAVDHQHLALEELLA